MSDVKIDFDFQYRTKRFKDAEKGLRAFAGDIEKSAETAVPILRKEIQEFLTNVTEALAQRHGNPYPSGTGPKTLSKRSGKAINRLRSSVKTSGNKLNDLQGQFSGPFYLKAQEYGAVIRPKRSKYLTIPLPAALNSNGTPKKKSAREWQNTFIQKSKKGNLIIFQKRGKDIVPLYVLKTQVRIPPRLGARETITKGLPYFVDKAVDAMLRGIRNA